MVLSEVARELSVSNVSVWRYIQAGRLRARKIGPIYVVDRADLEAFKAARRGPGRPKSRES